MNKILLVYEEYAELMNAENTLKRVGFDVIGISSEYSVAEQIVAFNPDLVVGSGRAGKVTSMGVGKRLKEMLRWQGRSVLIFPPNFKPSAQDLIKIRADLILESPVPPVRLLQVVAKLLGQDEGVLLEKLNKSMHVESAQKAATGGVFGSKHSTEDEPIVVRGSTEKQSDTTVGGDWEAEDSESSQPESHQPFKFGDRLTQADVEERSGDSTEEQAFPDVDLRALEQELTGKVADAAPESPTSGNAQELEAVGEFVTDSEPLKEDIQQSEAEAEVVAESVSEVEEDFVVSEPDGNQEDVNSQLSSEDSPLESREALGTASEQLRKAEVKLKEKIAKYSEMVENVKITPKSTLSRVEARRAWRDVVGEQDENAKDIDELRREFVQAMFKK